MFKRQAVTMMSATTVPTWTHFLALIVAILSVVVGRVSSSSATGQSTRTACFAPSSIRHRRHLLSIVPDTGHRPTAATSPPFMRGRGGFGSDVAAPVALSPLRRVAGVGVGSSSSTRLYNGYIIDVDDNFFTIGFFTVGLLYSVGKAYNRYLLEEVAWERRKTEAMERRLELDPTLTELDLRREDSANWPSVYGPDAQEKRRKSQRGGRGDAQRDEDEEGDYYEGGMTDEEISAFESTYGVEYDPYYDEPYEESELPVGEYREDRTYGDRRYDNGEVFYKDDETGLFYRQGSRPIAKKFWNFQ